MWWTSREERESSGYEIYDSGEEEKKEEFASVWLPVCEKN